MVQTSEILTGLLRDNEAEIQRLTGVEGQEGYVSGLQAANQRMKAQLAGMRIQEAARPGKAFLDPSENSGDVHESKKISLDEAWNKGD